ncbi:MAG: RNA polymerase factor sigma-54 [Deltaproteobacteria bacterium]|nr:RNA polymerase factor sigma-54 [Deltaproteobacteria bacterium]MBI3077284.1 RNA polymerase factor sigma-54 [Deltaproteobacteria bacterium]
MALEIKQDLRLSQQLVMTPQLQQAIKLLQLTRLELAQVVQQEMQENPLLEEGLEESAEPAEPGEEAEQEAPPEERQEPEIDWDRYIEEALDSSRRRDGEYEVAGDEDRPSYENIVTRKPSLYDHLMWQLGVSDLDEESRLVSAHIIGNLDEDGYLRRVVCGKCGRPSGEQERDAACEAGGKHDEGHNVPIPLSEAAQQAGVDEGTVVRVLARVQEFDPPGVGARTLEECLLLQIRFVAREERVADEVLKASEEIVSHHLARLERRDYQAIAKELGLGLPLVAEAARLIGQLEPKPGRPFSTETTQYITPDIFVNKVDDDYVVQVNEDGLPKLRINAVYRDMLRGKGDLPRQAREYIQEKFRSALWLIRSIHQRQRTIYRVTQSIVKFQREFLDKGIAYLKPLVLRDVANDIGMHESTISRVTTNKYVHTPQGVFELKFFFGSGIRRLHDGGEGIAAESVKEKIRQIITQENARKPLSDQEIVELLRAQDIDIARRTVTKYREMLGILPSSKRKKFY